MHRFIALPCAAWVAGAVLVLPVIGQAAPGTAKPAIRLSWDQCDPLVADKSFAGPGPYELVISASNWNGPCNAYQMELRFSGAGGAYPDAWRFDEGSTACQTRGRMSIGTQPVAKNCPSLQGGRPLQITGLVFGRSDEPANTARLILTNAFDTVQADASIRYTLWRVRFDHMASAVGKAPADSNCGGADAPFCIRIVNAESVNEKNLVFRDLAIENGLVTWQATAGTPSSCVDPGAPQGKTKGTGVSKSLEPTKSLGKPGAAPK